MSNRKLASIRQINDIHPIEGKDRIALAIVDGWSVIIQKSEFNVGDKCVYIEIDSVLPERPEFEFLRKNDFRIKTMKMAGRLSQGICFPFTILPPGHYEIGDDVTEVLGIKQYVPTMDTDPETPVPVKKNPLMRFAWYRKLFYRKFDTAFPCEVSKTDETRIQNAPHLLSDPNKKWIATEKMDGTSGTWVLRKRKRIFPLGDKYEFVVASRNKRLPINDGSIYWKIEDQYNLCAKMLLMIGDHDWIAIQGECLGPKIQGNKYGVLAPQLFVFNVITPEGRMDSLKARQFCSYNDLPFVPILSESMTLPGTVDEVLSMADGPSQFASVPREGIVFRSEDGKQSFKAVSPKFLMHYDA